MVNVAAVRSVRQADDLIAALMPVLPDLSWSTLKDLAWTIVYHQDQGTQVLAVGAVYGVPVLITEGGVLLIQWPHGEVRRTALLGAPLQVRLVLDPGAPARPRRVTGQIRRVRTQGHRERGQGPGRAG